MENETTPYGTRAFTRNHADAYGNFGGGLPVRSASAHSKRSSDGSLDR